MIDLISQLGDNEIIGLIVLVILIGQYFLAYNLYNFFKKYRDDIQPL